MKKVAVLLSGCGVFDGAEIHESVITLLSLARAGVAVQCYAPNREQLHVVNHLTGEVEAGQGRNILVEAARIARGEVKPLEDYQGDCDALILPGGFGAAKNLCNFALVGADNELHQDVQEFVEAFISANKPVGFVCISPVMMPKLLPAGVRGTIGTDADTAAAFNAMGGEHQSACVDAIVVDERYKVVSTPAYMLAGNITEAADGIEKLVAQVVDWI
ncbi:isoprenoid biosynthesis glyoxalase ElbB [Paraferrimonas sedimenticola]|uniref:Glyoxalase n=1 Tax=Paraferrimonas sedimenticola TaxID=375674 RepID=A0AA37RYC9_9GAMM|nr:isoprenoid biosynthesis glyoxalase ElbB [Paraferrimonas sedimenticola]GLP97563.1 glyoxalase [Paraferrimonas sedimenticola]